MNHLNYSFGFCSSETVLLTVLNGGSLPVFFSQRVFLEGFIHNDRLLFLEFYCGNCLKTSRNSFLGADSALGMSALGRGRINRDGSGVFSRALQFDVRHELAVPGSLPLSTIRGKAEDCSGRRGHIKVRLLGVWLTDNH